MQIRLARTALEGHAIAVLATAAVLLVRHSLDGQFSGQLPLISGLFAVIVAAWYGGLWPGLVATLLTVACGVSLFIDGGWPALRVGEVLLLSGFVLVASITSLLFEALHQANLKVGFGRTEVQRARRDGERDRSLANDAELRYRLVIEATRDAVYERDLPGGRVIWNDALGSRFGFSGEAVGADFDWWIERIHPADRERVRESLDAAQAAGQPRWWSEYRVRCADGREVWVLDRAGLTYDDQGRPLRAVGAIQDISERERSVEMLAHFKALFEAQPAPILVMDPEFRIVAASDAYLRHTMRERVDIIGRPVFEAFPGDDDAAGVSLVRDSFERVLATGESEQLPILQYSVERPASEGGAFKRALWSLYHFPVRGPRNEVAFVVQRADDVTDFVQDGQVSAPMSDPRQAALRDARDFEHARLLAEANRRLGEANARLAFLSGLSEATRALEDPAAIMAVITERLGRHLAARRCAWFEVAGDGEHFEVLADYTVGVESIRGQQRLSDYGIPALLRGRSTYVMDDIEADGDAASVRAAYRRIETRAVIAVPLRRDDRILAGLAVHDSTPRRWMPHEVELVEVVAERCRDMLERVRAIGAVSDSETRLRVLLDAMPAKIGTIAADGSLLYLHHSWNEYSGLALERPDIGALEQLFHPEDLPPYLLQRTRGLKSGEPFAHEVRIRRHDGEYRWHLSRLAPIKDAAGQVRSWVKVVTEIHDLKMAEAALRDRARQLGFIVALSNEVQALDEADGILTKVTRSLRAHLNCDRVAYVRVEPDQDHYQVLMDSARNVQSRIGRHRFSEFGAEAARRLHGRQPYVVADVRASLQAEARDAFALAQIGALIFYPLFVGERFAAGLAVHQREARHWSAGQIELVGLAARICWAGVERANALHHLRESNDHLRFLAKLSESLQPMPDAATIARTVCEAVGRRLRANRCGFVRVEPDAEHYSFLAEYRDGVGSRLGRRHFSCFGEAWWKQLLDLRPVVINNVQEDAGMEVDVEACRNADIGAVILMPLQREHRLVGLFVVHDRRRREWTRAEIEAVDLSGNLCSESINRADSAMQEALSRRKLRDILDRIPVKIVTMTPQCRIDYAGPVTRAYMEAGEGGIPDWLSRVHPEDRPRADAMVARMLRGETPDQEELRLQRHDGVQRWHLTRFLPLHGQQAEVLSWVGAWTDLHDLKAAELQLREADRMKDEFLATLAHELRNPLGPIANGVELLQRAGGQEQVRAQTLDLISRQLTQMVRLVDDLLDISRITTGKLKLRRADVPIADVIRNAVESVEPLVLAGQHQLELQLPADPVVVHGDAARLSQVLANLLSNSAKYSERPGTIRLEAALQGPDVVVSVHDQGIGIPPSALPFVFEMFMQADPALTRAQGGLGVGLSLVRRLVELHGGSVEGRSEGAGQGSTFTIRLPAVVREAAAPSPAAERAAPVPAAAAASARRRVLIADDNVDNADSLAALLEIWGHEVQIANDGQVALERAAQFHPDVMVLDLGMPRLDGLATAIEVRRQDWGRDVVLIALSGWGQPSDRDRSRAAGFDHHLVKPVETAVLERLLATSRRLAQA